MGFFDDERRIAVRRRTGDGFLKDYFLQSEVTDYVRLRVVVNLFFGCGVCTAIYYMGWGKLNFADFEAITGLLMMVVMIGCAAYAFAISPLFRSAFFLVLLAAFGKHGQYPFTILIINNLQEGPIQNIVDNYERMAQMVMCHINMQAKVTANRVAILTGPLEGILEKASAHGLKTIQKAVNSIRRVIGPFMKELADRPTEEDKIQDLTEEQVEMIERRKSKLLHNYQQSMGGEMQDDDEFIKDLLPNSEDRDNFTDAPEPEWTKFKTSTIQRLARRLSNRCHEMFNKGVDLCRKLSIEMKERCENLLIWPIENFFCPKFTVEKLCQNVERRVTQFSLCRKHLEDSKLTDNFEGDASKLSNLTSELDREARINLHMVAIQSPRIEIEYQLEDLKLKAKELATYVKVSSMVMQQIFNALFVFLIYTIFRDAVHMIIRFNRDIDFNNIFITSEFWAIDAYRREAGEESFTAFSKKEKRDWRISKVFSWPTQFEREKAYRPFARWLVIAFVVASLCIFDYYFYLFLFELTNQNVEEEKLTGKSQSKLQFKGKGILVDYLNSVLAHNKTVEIDSSINNEECLNKPNKPNVDIIIYWLVIPLTLSFLLQVIFSFIIRRIIFNYYLPFMYPKRARSRLIHLYNKLILRRSTERQANRKRIRFLVSRWCKEVGYQTHRNIVMSDSLFKLHIVDRLLKIGKCLLCYEYMRPVSLLYCASPKCKAVYCSQCVLENFGKCYACQVEANLVDSERSQLIPVDLKEIPQELSRTYGGAFMNNREKARQMRDQITEREKSERAEKKNDAAKEDRKEEQSREKPPPTSTHKLPFISSANSNLSDPDEENKQPKKATAKLPQILPGKSLVGVSPTSKGKQQQGGAKGKEKLPATNSKAPGHKKKSVEPSKTSKDAAKMTKMPPEQAQQQQQRQGQGQDKIVTP